MTAIDQPTAESGAAADAAEPNLLDRARGTQIGRSIFRTPTKRTPRDRAASHWSSFLLHIYPVKIRRKELSWQYPWYLGVISTVLFGSLAASGLYLITEDVSALLTTETPAS